MQGILRMYDVSRDNGIAAILLFCFVLIVAAFVMGGTLRIFDLPRLLGNKERASIFAKTSLFSGKINTILTLQFQLALGLFIVLTAQDQSGVTLNDEYLPLYVLAAAGIMSVYLFVWLRVIALLGKLFSSEEVIKLWIRDFIALAGGTGMVLFCIVVGMVYVKSFLTWGFFAGIGLLGLFKLMTIYKGVRLFFNDLYSILYLILYLCALEIIPLLLLCKGVLYLVEMI